MDAVSIANKNEIGITHYKRGDAKNAVAAFSEALMQAKQCIIAGGHEDDGRRDHLPGERCQAICDVHDDDNDECSWNLSKREEEVTVASADHKQEQEEAGTKNQGRRTPRPASRDNKGQHHDDSSSTASYYIFRRTFSISPSLLSRHCCNKGAVEASAKILFNIALCYHRLGYENGSARNVLLKAVQVYELTCSLIKNSAAHEEEQEEELRRRTLFSVSSSSLSSWRSLMFAALTNNLGHVHHLLGNHEQASRCFEHLFMVLVYDSMIAIRWGGRRSNNNTTTTTTVDDGDRGGGGGGGGLLLDSLLYEKFFSNAVPLMLSKRGDFAPAA